MNKKPLLIIVVVIVIAVVAWMVVNKPATTGPTKPTAQQAAEDIQKTAASVSADVGKNVSPNVKIPAVNPVNTDANPYNKTNPFSNLKTNPFQ